MALGLWRHAPRHWQKAVQLLQRCRDSRVALDVVCFSSLARSLEESALWQKSLRLLQDMDTQSIQPNAVTLTAVFRALGRSGQATTARELAERMERRRLELDALAMVALSFAQEQGSQWHRALAALAASPGPPGPPGQSSHAPPALGVALAACEKAALWREALQLVDSWSKLGLNGMMVNSLLSTFSKTLKWKLSLLLSGAWDDPLDAVGLAALFSACEEGRGATPLSPSMFNGDFRRRTVPSVRFWGTEVTKLEELQSRGHLPAQAALAFRRGVVSPLVDRLTRSQKGVAEPIEEVLDLGLSFTREALNEFGAGRGSLLASSDAEHWSGPVRLRSYQPLPTRPLRLSLPVEAHVLLSREDMKLASL
ncbi:unnamed protein product [Cladocopium goreaui]|uniref:Pentacotripeptide-repeat region of PRORP domain-containing protein n=1 Tax=Cladocopium goreaui TaxID=2562237 RepID=A0A9P1LZX9_9DINO|nr:unnamed protein product [Cladocopium goreaui]